MLSSQCSSVHCLRTGYYKEGNIPNRLLVSLIYKGTAFSFLIQKVECMCGILYLSITKAVLIAVVLITNSTYRLLSSSITIEKLNNLSATKTLPTPNRLTKETNKANSFRRIHNPWYSLSSIEIGKSETKHYYWEISESRTVLSTKPI